MSTTSPYMNLIIPTVGVTSGPQYASDINTSFNLIDLHDHSSGKGVAISPSGLFINADLPILSNNLTQAKTVRFTSNASTITNASPNIGCVYVSGNELYYNDYSGGHIVQITNNGALSTGAGTVTSVGINGPSIITWTNTPVTSIGTLTGALASQSANTVLAGPTSGGAATPTFRVLSTSDFVAPTNQQFTSTGTQTGWVFTVSSANATIGATYTNNSNTYVVVGTVSSGTLLFVTGTGATTGGTLTKSTGTGDASITFSAKTAIASYTLPSSPRAPLYIRLKLVGGGGGGGPGGASTVTPATAGGPTYFMGNSKIIYGNGGGAGALGAIGGAGGTASLASAGSGIAQTGQGGMNGGSYYVSGGTAVGGGAGGSNPYGFGGSFGDYNSSPKRAPTGYGSGGGGGTYTSGASGAFYGSGGASGGWIDGTISGANLVSTFYYAIGAGGSGAVGAADNGDNGLSGFINVDERYQ